MSEEIDDKSTTNETTPVQNKNEELINEMKNVFQHPIQKDYISNYLDSFPQSPSYNKIKEMLNAEHSTDILQLYDVDNTKIDMNNLCKINENNENNENIECFMGNVNLQQLANGFMNGSENVIDLLDKDQNIIKPFAKGKLDLLKYISIIASRDESVITNYDEYLKSQIGKDIMRDELIINNRYISHILKSNSIFQYFYDTTGKLSYIDRTNILSLEILRELIDKLGNKLNQEEIYDKLMLLSILLHQGIHAETLLIFNKYIKEIVKKINKNNRNYELHNVIFISPDGVKNEPDLEIKTSVHDPKPNDKMYKFIKLVINNDEISITSMLYRKFVFIGDFDNPYIDGHFFSVLHFDILNLTYEIKYLTIDINYQYIPPTKFDKIKENISKNKPAVTAGTLLTLGALSAIPIALLLGGRKTRKRLFKKYKNNKNNKNKNNKNKKSKKINKRNKTKKNNKNNKNNQKHKRNHHFKTKHRR